MRSRENRVARIYESACEVIQKEQPKVIFCSVAPPSTALAGERLARDFGLPLVVDIRDPWSYGPRVPYRHLVDFFIERRIEQRVLSAAAYVITPTIASRQLIIEELGVPSEKTLVIPNGFSETNGMPNGEIEPGVFTLLHAGEIGVSRKGGLGFSRRIKNLLRMDYDPMERDFGTRSVNVALGALDLLFSRRPALRNKVRLRLLGADSAEIQEAVRQSNSADRVIAERRVSQDVANEYICRADALLLLQVSYWLEGRPFAPQFRPNFTAI
ncbi:MAG: glycosyltransferase [Rhodanobacteraceae bacterium]|nr:glycosyltransferase [Rhodanobacteraceae bacterium]